MELRLNGRIFSIGQLGPDFLMLDDPADHPPAKGEIILSIDGWERRWMVRLPEGFASSGRRRRFATQVREQTRASTAECRAGSVSEGSYSSAHRADVQLSPDWVGVRGRRTDGPCVRRASETKESKSSPDRLPTPLFFVPDTPG
jgi:hypothetical protein